MAQHIPTKSIRFVVFLTAALGLGLVSQPAFAKKKRSSTIQMTGIKSFDKIFKKARTTDKRLKSAEKSLKKSKKALRQENEHSFPGLRACLMEMGAGCT